jgi:hypothetical protein
VELALRYKFLRTWGANPQMEVVSLKNMTHKVVIHFILEHIVHRFGIPQTLTTDQGSSFMSHQVCEFAESLKIKFLSSSPYYAQANGQTDSNNKTLIKLIKKKIEEISKRWHEVYGQEAILPVEVIQDAFRITQQNELSAVDYHNLMLDGLDKTSDERIKASGEIERDKLRVARVYNKKVKEKSFQVRDLVWKMILPIGSKSNKFGK